MNDSKGLRDYHADQIAQEAERRLGNNNATEQVCEYCKHGEPMQARIIDGESGWPEIYIEKSDLVYTNGNYECVFSAKFCPMCGRSLR